VSWDVDEVEFYETFAEIAADPNRGLEDAKRWAWSALHSTQQELRERDKENRKLRDVLQWTNDQCPGKCSAVCDAALQQVPPNALAEELVLLRTELLEHARLAGMGSEREARLMAQLEEATKALEAAYKHAYDLEQQNIALLRWQSVASAAHIDHLCNIVRSLAASDEVSRSLRELSAMGVVDEIKRAFDAERINREKSEASARESQKRLENREGYLEEALRELREVFQALPVTTVAFTGDYGLYVRACVETLLEQERESVVRFLRQPPEKAKACDKPHRHEDGKPCLVLVPVDLDEAADLIEQGKHILPSRS